MQQRISRLYIGEGPDLALYDPRTKGYIRVRDTRHEREKAPVSKSLADAFLKSRKGNRQLSSEPTAMSARDGGLLCAGVSYGESLRHFRDSTGVYFDLLAPATIGPQPNAQLLYMTASNGAAAGCEALLSFAADQQFQGSFAVFDWSYPAVTGGGHFVKSCSYNELLEYLIPRKFVLDSGQELDTICVSIANLTRRTSGDNFQNEVYLKNNEANTFDLKWSHAYEWGNQAVSEGLWWGPIFEADPNPGAQFALQNPLGFDQAMLAQDGTDNQLTSQNSSLALPTGHGLQEIYRSPSDYGGLICR